MLIGVFEHTDLFFDLLLELFVVHLPHLAVEATNRVVVSLTIVIGPFWAFDELMPRLASQIWLRSQDGAFILEWSRFLNPCASILFLDVTEASHHRVQVEALGLCAAEHRRLLPVEQHLCLLTSRLLGLSVDQGALALVTDVFFNLLLLVVVNVVVVALTVHHAVHGRELAIGWRLTLVVLQTTESVSSLVTVHLVSTCLEVVTSAELLFVAVILGSDL